MAASQKALPRVFPEKKGDDDSTPRYRQLIGILGLALPLLLWLVAAWRPSEGFPAWDLLSSISAYYYTGAVAIFTGILVALALFLLTYKGYQNRYRPLDRWTAVIAGLAAFFVAFFPTRAPVDSAAFPWWRPIMGGIHLGAACVLFACFIFFSGYLFTRPDPVRKEPWTFGRRFRWLVYVVCAFAMFACIIWIVFAMVNKTSIFWPEALALGFFAISWLVKGRADRTVGAVSLRVVRAGGYVFSPLRRARTNAA